MTFAGSMLSRCGFLQTPLRHDTIALRRAGLVAATAKSRCATIQLCRRAFARVSDVDKCSHDIFFAGTAPKANNTEGNKPPDERTVQLGKTIRTLSPLLPTLLLTPLPQSILSPRISLHLFPSTHPHLPTVTGKLAYNAALWTAPVAWGRIPLIGNVRLKVLSERMVRHGGTAWRTSTSADDKDSSAGGGSGGDEKLVVKWKTCGKTTHRDGTGGIYRGIGLSTKDPVEKIKGFIAGAARKEEAPELEEEFCGLFAFEFDSQGRVVKHVIEHMEEGGNDEKWGRVVSVTDWLLGGFRGRRERDIELAWFGGRGGGDRRLQR